MKKFLSRLVTASAVVATAFSLLGSQCWEPKDRLNPLDPRADYWEGRPLDLAAEIAIDSASDTLPVVTVTVTWRDLEHDRLTAYHVFCYYSLTPNQIYDYLGSRPPGETSFVDTVDNSNWEYWYYVAAILDSGIDSVVSDTVITERLQL
ncbi:MAG: hypothetical protein JSW34_10970 [Candidatus Zixiibacteriota bacterium]|nr:MAG: hypothetical protein JSW34_10970 [candidate division Zixibacteria bacterium]